jgi:DNA-binding GntR family transcriptional regulator
MLADERYQTATQVRTRGPQLSRQVYEWLRDRILLHLYAPGQRLVVRDLARELGVSVTPVRDAVNRLAIDGLIVISPRKGTVITPLSVGDIREFYEVRLMIEPAAAELAAASLSTEELDQLETLLRELEGAPREFSDARAYVRHLTRHADFHARIVHGARNERLAALYAGLARSLVFSRSFYPSGQRGQTDRPYEHREIFEALRRRDGPAARRAVEVHLVRAAEDILHYLARSTDTLTNRHAVDSVAVPIAADGASRAGPEAEGTGEAEPDVIALARLEVLCSTRRVTRPDRR